MSQTITGAQLRQDAMEFIRRHTTTDAQAWPRFGQDFQLEDGDCPPGSLLFSCRTDAGMANGLGIVHGGITAALVDTCMGITCAAQAIGAPTPTITMTVNYARPVPLNADILVRTHTVRIGAASGQMTAEVFPAEKPEEILATATGVYAIRRGAIVTAPA